MKELKEYIRSIPDFPEKGIIFRDVTSVLQDADALKLSIHFTPGCCYDDAYNGNNSAIHWDLVMIQRPEYGGGEMYFDDVLVRKDGRFVVPICFLVKLLILTPF